MILNLGLSLKKSNKLCLLYRCFEIRTIGEIHNVIAFNQDHMNQLEKFLYYSAPHMWLQVADELKNTIDKLYEDRVKEIYYQNFYLEYPDGIKIPSVNRGVILLMNFCLENLLKGILILRDIDRVKTGKLDSELKTHNLVKLFKLCLIELSEMEEQILSYLSNACINTGRYPIGLTKGASTEIRVIGESEYEIFRTIFFRLHEILVREYQENGWKTGLNNSMIDCEPDEFKYIRMK